MFRDDEATRARLKRVVREWVRPARIIDRVPVEVTSWEVPDEPVSFTEAAAQQFVPFSVGESWSKPWGTTWFHLRGTVPRVWEDSDGHTRHELVVDLGFSTVQPGFQAEGTVYRPDGTVVKGLEPLNSWVPVATLGGEPFEFFVEAASNPSVMKEDWTTPSELGLKSTAGTAPIYRVRTMEIQRIDIEVERLLAEIEVLDGWVDELGEPRKKKPIPMETVFGSRTVPSDVAAVILRAVIRAKESGDIIMDSDPWRFIELLAADYLAGATA